MAKPKRASPGVGHNGPPVDHDIINQALSDCIFYDEQVKLLNEKKKAMRKGWEGRRVILSEIDNLVKMKDEPESKIIEFFRTRFHYLGAVFRGLPKQFDLFTAKVDAPEKEAAYRHMGFMAGVKGEDPTVPANLSGEALQLWTDGYNDGAAKREVSNTTFWGKALENGGVVDGTGKGAVTDQVRAQAAADFAKDNPGVVDLGEKQRPAEGDQVTASDVVEVIEGLVQDVKDQGSASAGSEEPFEAPQAELDAQAGRPVREEEPAAPAVDESALAAKLSGETAAFKTSRSSGGKKRGANLAKSKPN